MSEPQWIDRQMLLLMHARHLELYGGTPGIRSQAELENALAAARKCENDLYRQAAAYLVAIAGAGGLQSGNARLGLTACLCFLSVNGYDIRVPNAQIMVAATLEAGRKRLSADRAHVWVRGWTRERIL